MEYIIASLVAILIATLLVYKLANRLFGLNLRLKSLLLCAVCAMFISLVLPRFVVGFAGLPGTLAFLAVFAAAFAYFVAHYEETPATDENESACCLAVSQAKPEATEQVEVTGGLQNETLSQHISEPVALESIVEEPVVEEPIIVEEVTVEESIVEETTAEEPTVKELIVEEPTVKELIVEEPTVEEPTVEEPTVEEPVMEEPTVEEPVVEEPTVEEPVVEEPIVEEPMVEEPVVEEPMVEEPMVEESTVEESTVEEPVVEEPIVEDLQEARGDSLSAVIIDNRGQEEYIKDVPQLLMEQAGVTVLEAGDSVRFYKEEEVEVNEPVAVQLEDLLDYAFVNKEQHNYEVALMAFSQALSLYPESEAAPFLVVEVGNLLKNKGHYDEAIRVFSEGRQLCQTREDEMLEQEFISTIAYLRIIKNILVQHRLGSVKFSDIPQPIAQEIDEEFREWRNVANI